MIPQLPERLIPFQKIPYSLTQYSIHSGDVASKKSNYIILLLLILFSYHLEYVHVWKATVCPKDQCLTTWDKGMRNMSACELTPLHKACISCPSISNTLILLSEHNRTCSNSMKDKPLNFRFDFFFVEMILWDVIFIDGSMGLPICQTESFWPQNLERSTVTESKLSDQKKPKIQMQKLTEVMSRTFSLPKMERGQCWTRKEQYNK